MIILRYDNSTTIKQSKVQQNRMHMHTVLLRFALICCGTRACFLYVLLCPHLAGHAYGRVDGQSEEPSFRHGRQGGYIRRYYSLSAPPGK